VQSLITDYSHDGGFAKIVSKRLKRAINVREINHWGELFDFFNYLIYIFMILERREVKKMNKFYCKMRYIFRECKKYENEIKWDYIIDRSEDNMIK
jgi:hypothetical protein